MSDFLSWVFRTSFRFALLFTILKNMMSALARTLRASLTSRLSRQMGGWVFTGIFVVELVIFLPSAYRRKHEVLEAVTTISQSTANALAIASPDEATFISHLPQLRQNSPVKGTILYNAQGQQLYQFGQGVTLDFAEAKALKSELTYGKPWSYETTVKIDIQGQPYYLIVDYEAKFVTLDLIVFSMLILAFILIIAATVTGLMMWIINDRLIVPMLWLQQDMIQSGQAIEQGQPLPEFSSKQYQRRNELLEMMQAFYQSHGQIVAAIEQRDRSEANLKQTATQLEMTLSELKKAQAQLIHTEKMSSLKQLGAGFAHEINNPINFIQANLGHFDRYGQDLIAIIHHYQQELPQPSEVLQDYLESVDFQFIERDIPNLVKSMQSGTSRIRDLVTSFKGFVRLDEADCKAVNIHEGLNGALLLLQGQLAANKLRPEIQVQRSYGELPLIDCFPKQLNQVFMDLLVNAIEAINLQAKTGCQESPSIVLQTSNDESNIKISIIDNGSGIAPENQSKVFEPFFTTKDVGQGMGLGLTNSYRIIEEIHQGHIEFVSLEQGTMFNIYLPLGSDDV